MDPLMSPGMRIPRLKPEIRVTALTTAFSSLAGIDRTCFYSRYIIESILLATRSIVTKLHHSKFYMRLCRTR